MRQPGFEAIILDFGGVFTKTRPRDVVLSRCEHDLGLTRGALIKLLFVGEHWWRWSTGFCSADEYWEQIRSALGGEVPPVLEPFKSNPFAYEELNCSMARLVRRWHTHYRIALLSNATPYLETVIAAYHLTDLFDAVVNSARVRLRKPDPTIYRLTLDRLQLRPEHCLFIDDKERNTTVARELGMSAIEFHSAADLERQMGSIMLARQTPPRTEPDHISGRP
jgi:epoxide hydrolase-like predicted phosphatase